MGNSWYVSPTGNSVNDGKTPQTPLDFATAINGSKSQNPTIVQPGDTIWMLPGTYKPPTSDGFFAYLQGQPGNPILIRNYQQGRVTLDGANCAFVLALGDNEGGVCQYVWIWPQASNQNPQGCIELIDSSGVRDVALATDPNPIAFGFADYGPGNKFINCVVHDTTEGISSYDASPGAEYTGNLIYYNGYNAPDRVHGHGIYIQNIVAYKTVLDCIVGDNFCNGIQAYGSGGASITGLSFAGCLLYNTASLPSPHYQYNIVLGNGENNYNNNFDSMYSYLTLAQRYGFVNFGQYAASSQCSCTNSVFVGGYGGPAVEGMGSPFTFTGNRVLNIQPDSTGVPISLLRLGQFANQSLSGFTWDNNQYFGLNELWGVGTYAADANLNYTDTGGTDLTLAQWQAKTGFDAHSTYQDANPSENWIYVRPNKYASKRGHVCIYNWLNQNSVAVDLSSILAPGDSFVIQDAQNFFGASLLQGTYQGGTVSIPMVGLTKAAPLGVGTPAHTAPAYGTFVVIGPSQDIRSPRKLKFPVVVGAPRPEGAAVRRLQLSLLARPSKSSPRSRPI